LRIFPFSIIPFFAQNSWFLLVLNSFTFLSLNIRSPVCAGALLPEKEAVEKVEEGPDSFAHAQENHVVILIELL